MPQEDVKSISTIHLAGNIRILRRGMGLSQEELAMLVDLNRGNIASYENGSAEPRIRSLVKLAHTFRVSLVDFVLLDLKDQKAFELATQNFRSQGEKDLHVLDNCSQKLTELKGVRTSLQTCHHFKRKILVESNGNDHQGFANRFEDLYEVADKLLGSHKKLIEFVQCRLNRKTNC